MSREPNYIGKVRDVYDLGDALLLVSSDRISAFDCVFSEKVPEKGKILNRISNQWFHFFNKIPNHILETDHKKFPIPFQSEEFKDRAVLVQKCKRIDYECVVRGYIAGSLWKEYKNNGTLNFEKTDLKLKESQKLPEPIFTPAVKNDSGHDENISEAELKRRIGENLFNKLKETSLILYTEASTRMKNEGIILCDTKFEFGIYKDEVLLIDEVLTPDSSRYWDESSYREGSSPPSYDKQILRDYLESTEWNKEPPAPSLPKVIIEKIVNKYKEIETKIYSCT
jgi:phosphoribosylaminoimidazole-succinocarboxamide synthase